uniref:Uncharacterized protein n=1 Tax=Arundo donax TaxID=35708 RepID=A0A0A9FQR8_ARUDO
MRPLPLATTCEKLNLLHEKLCDHVIHRLFLGLQQFAHPEQLLRLSHAKCSRHLSDHGHHSLGETYRFVEAYIA